MDYENERYVRLYTRDTTTWLLLGWAGNAVLSLLMRKLDRAGRVALDGCTPAEVASVHTRMPLDICEAGMGQLLARGTFIVEAEHLFMPNFVEGQTAKKSDAQRQRESRERRHEAPPPRDRTEQTVTKRDESSRAQSQPSQSVTLSLAQPSLAQQGERARAPEVAPRTEPEPELGEPPAEQSLTQVIRSTYFRLYAAVPAHAGATPPETEAFYKAVVALGRWCTSNAVPLKRSDCELARAVIRGLFASKKDSVIAKHYPLGFAAQDPLEFLTGESGAAAEPADITAVRAEAKAIREEITRIEQMDHISRTSADLERKAALVNQLHKVTKNLPRQGAAA